jgi:NADH:ubiquinone oxidoreductase subunit 3 (subunit A)
VFLTDFLLAIIVAIIFSGILVGFTSRRGPGPFGGLAFFFLLIFLITFVGGVYYPWEPYSVANAFLVFLVLGFLVMLFIAVLLPPARQNLSERRSELNAQYDPGPAPGKPGEDESDQKESAEMPVSGAEIIISSFFWIFLIAMIVLIVIGYA